MLNNPRQLVFVKTPKTAGTSICKLLTIIADKCLYLEAIRGRRIKIAQKQDISRYDIIIVTDVLFKHFYRTYRDELVSSDIIAVVRNPFDRFVSAYCQMSQSCQLPPINTLLQRRHIRYKPLLGRIFNVYNSEDVHLFRTYYSFLYDRRKLLVDNIFKYEQLPLLLKFLSAHKGIKVPSLPHLNSRPESQKGISLTQNERSKIYKLYRKDFDAFHYQGLTYNKK